jgi:carboxylesterase type B
MLYKALVTMVSKFFSVTAIIAFVFAGAFVPSAYAAPNPGSMKLPVVDLGYSLHRPVSFNSTGNFYNFSNIRYAAPPTGENRFRVPQPPDTDRITVQTGLPDRICPQANPAWLGTAKQFLSLYLAGQTQFNTSSFNTSSSEGGLPPQDPRTTEDCLFLDVVVPKPIFDRAGKDCGAAVLVWIYGGGYTTGSKSSWGNPAGLLARSETDDQPGVIVSALTIVYQRLLLTLLQQYVSFNYRLGAFGWLSGPTFQEAGTANAGLHDQRFALEWVKQYIHLFGGDPNRITVIGESAGGGSIMHQITAYGGQNAAPFEQAIVQSPGFFPIVSNKQQEQIFNDYLALVKVDTIQEARQLPFSSLQNANLKQVGASPYGLYTYGPAVDGDFVPALPGQLLLHEQFSKDVKVMVGHDANEVSFTNVQMPYTSSLADT